MLIGIAHAGIEASQVLHQLFDVFELASAAGDDDASDQFFRRLIIAVIFDFSKDGIDDFRAACMDNAA